MNYSSLKAAIAISMTLFFLPAIPGTIVKGKKIALIIGIGKYKPGNHWPTIHGDNDIDVIKHALVNTGFSENNIQTLKNENATKAGIVSALKTLLEKTTTGDVVIIHYSGHGQQISDMSGDEADGLDEALVPFDAPAVPDKSREDAYDLSKHLSDDELSVWFDSFRNKIGISGQLIVIVDACHSGTVSRGNGTIRGGVPPFLISTSIQKKISAVHDNDESGYLQPSVARGNNQQSKFIMISAARAEESDYEYKEKQMGSLSYSVADALENKLKSSENSFRDMFEYIRNTMAIIVPSQNPQLEGDKDIKIFDGDILIQQPFYKVLGENNNKLLEISAGRVLGVTIGTTIGLYPIGTRSTEGKTAIVTGKVTTADYLKSEIELDRKINPDSAKSLQAFILNPVFDNSRVMVFFDKIPDEIKNKVQTELSAKKIGIVQDITNATLIIEMARDKKDIIQITNALDRTPIVSPFGYKEELSLTDCGGNVTGRLDAAAYIARTITNYSKNNVLKNATFGDNNFGLKVRVIPAKINEQTNEAVLISGQPTIPVFKTENSQALLRIENTGLSSGYVYLIEFDPSGKICPILGFDTEIKMEPGRKYEVNIPGFAEPFGRYLMKGYITQQPIGSELSLLINEQNAGARSAGSNNRLVSLLGDLIANPGSSRGPNLDKSGGVSITNFSYDIVNE